MTSYDNPQTQMQIATTRQIFKLARSETNIDFIAF